jgi:rfaE bifunctional protein nucleotidyltransferase chain/domain
VQRIFNFTTNKNDITNLLLKLKVKNRKIVFTNGCFDLLHSGHVYLINESKKLGDILIVGINSDKSIKLLKEIGRPIICENDRVYILSNLKPVDFVIIFDDYSVLDLIKFISPDVITKSSQYSITDLENVGGKFMRDSGKKLILIPHKNGNSTTEIIKKIQK